MNAAVLAKRVLCGPSVELVGRQFVLAGEKLEAFRRHDQMQNSFLGAYRAVAIAHVRKISRDPEPHAAAMAAALHRPEHARRLWNLLPRDVDLILRSFAEQAELRGIARRLGKTEMAEGVRRQQPTARSALQETPLDQEGLDNFFDCVARLRQRRRYGLDSNRTTAVVLRDRNEVAPVHGIEPGGIDLELDQRAVGGDPIDRGCARDQRKVTHPAQQPAGNARRAARPAGDLVRAVGGHADAEHARAAVDDLFELTFGIKIESHWDAEAVTQRISEQTGAGGRTDQRKGGEIDLDRARGGSLADDEVELKVLHRRIEDLLDRRIEPMDLVDEKDIAFFEIRQQSRKIAGLGDHRSRRGTEIHAKLARHDLCERRLAEAGGTDKQHVIERLAPHARRLDEY